MKVPLWCWVTGNMVPEPGRHVTIKESREHLGCQADGRNCNMCLLLRVGEPTPELAPSYHEWIEVEAQA